MKAVKITKVVYRLLKLGNNRASGTRSFIQQIFITFSVFPHTYNRDTVKCKTSKIIALVGLNILAHISSDSSADWSNRRLPTLGYFIYLCWTQKYISSEALLAQVKSSQGCG